MCMHRCSLSSSPLFVRTVPGTPPRAFLFSVRSFLVHGETSAAAARRWTAAGTRLLVQGRCSPSEVLPRLPITRASFCLSFHFTSSPPSLPFRLHRAALFRRFFSLAFSRYHPPAPCRFYSLPLPPSSVPPPSISRF